MPNKIRGTCKHSNFVMDIISRVNRPLADVEKRNIKIEGMCPFYVQPSNNDVIMDRTL